MKSLHKQADEVIKKSSKMMIMANMCELHIPDVLLCNINAVFQLLTSQSS